MHKLSRSKQPRARCDETRAILLSRAYGLRRDHIPSQSLPLELDSKEQQNCMEEMLWRKRRTDAV